MLNKKTKGDSGEREVAQALNDILVKILYSLGKEIPEVDIVQRNKNQAAVGGSDLSNTLGLCIEVKRQEALSINTWWKQCTAAAERNKDIPVLIYRQNRKPWKVVIPMGINIYDQRVSSGSLWLNTYRAEIAWDDFLDFFECWARTQISLGVQVRV